MRMLAVCALAFVFTFSMFTTAHAFDEPVITLKSSFVDSEGRLNVVGTVRNYADSPVQVTVGVETDDGRTMQAETYGRVIWPLTDSPFKIVLEQGVNASDPFIVDIREVEASNYNSMLVLNYGSMAIGEERAFVGTVKNTGPFEMYNVSVFAAVHSPDHTSQLDTVRSNVIPVIKPGEELEFIAVPETAGVDQAIEALKTFEGSREALATIYLIGPGHKLIGAVPLVKIATSLPGTRLDALSEPYIACAPDNFAAGGRTPYASAVRKIRLLQTGPQTSSFIRPAVKSWEGPVGTVSCPVKT